MTARPVGSRSLRSFLARDANAVEMDREDFNWRGL